jgi:hypothetical protein
MEVEVRTRGLVINDSVFPSVLVRNTGGVAFAVESITADSPAQEVRVADPPVFGPGSTVADMFRRIGSLPVSIPAGESARWLVGFAGEPPTDLASLNIIVRTSAGLESKQPLVAPDDGVTTTLPS